MSRKTSEGEQEGMTLKYILESYEMDSLIQNIYSKLSLDILQRAATNENITFFRKELETLPCKNIFTLT